MDSVKVAQVDAQVHVEEHALTVVTQSAQLVRDAPIRVVVVAQIVVAQLVLVSVQDVVRDVQIVWGVRHNVEAHAFNRVPIIQELAKDVVMTATPLLCIKWQATQILVVPRIPLEVQILEL